MAEEKSKKVLQAEERLEQAKRQLAKAKQEESICTVRAHLIQPLRAQLI